MSGLFRRKKTERQGPQHDDEGDRYLDLITRKVNDADGNFFGEVVSADVDCFIIKHGGGFYRFPVSNVQNKFGDLMLSSNIDLNLARKRGDQWKEPGKDIIRENKVYDFSEKKRLEQERNDRILMEMEKARELALQTTIGSGGPATVDISGTEGSVAEDQEMEPEDSGNGEEVPEDIPGDEDEDQSLKDNDDEGTHGEEGSEMEEENPEADQEERTQGEMEVGTDEPEVAGDEAIPNDEDEDDEAHDAEEGEVHDAGEDGDQKSSIDDAVSAEDDHTASDATDTTDTSGER